METLEIQYKSDLKDLAENWQYLTPEVRKFLSRLMALKGMKLGLKKSKELRRELIRELSLSNPEC